jgi:hypothetical protein
MVIMCENMLVPTKYNWLDLLRAAELVNSNSLKLLVRSFLRDNFDALLLEPSRFDSDTSQVESEQTPSGSSMRSLQEEFPQLLEDLLFARSECCPAPPSKALMTQIQESKEVTVQARRLQFPFWALGLGLVCLILYQHVSTILPLGIFIPVMNIGGSLAFGYLLYRHILL